MPTSEQKEMHRAIRAQVRGAVEVNQNKCVHYGNPTFDCYFLYNKGVEKPCFDACYRIFLNTLNFEGENSIHRRRGSE